MAYRWGGRSEEDQGAEVGSTLVGESTGSVDEGADTVGLDGRTANGATPRGSSGGGLLRVEELLLGVGLLRPAVGVSEDGAQDCERDGVVEGCAESNCRGLDGGEVCEDAMSDGSIPSPVHGEVTNREVSLQWRDAIAMNG